MPPNGVSSTIKLFRICILCAIILQVSSVPLNTSTLAALSRQSSSQSPSSSPSPSASLFPSMLQQPSQQPTTTRPRVRGVWPITKIAGLFGPTVAIFLYDRVHNAYEQYQPFVNAAVLDFIQHIQAAVQSPYSSKPVIWLSSMPSSNSHVTTIANEIVRLTNVRLREHAVVSRLQMDDDQYEFSKSLSASHVRSTALRVMQHVLTNGSGRYLQPEEKIAVHALVASSVY